MNGRTQAQFQPIGPIIVVILIITMGAGLYSVLSSHPEPAVKFSYCDWMESEITASEKGYLQVQVKNTSDDDYDVMIQIATKSSDVTISRLDETSEFVNGEYRLTHSVGILARHEVTRLYTFNIEVTLEPGTVSEEIEVMARLLANGEVMDEKTLTLTIKAER